MKITSINTDRIILEPLTIKHVSNDYVEWLNNKNINKYLETKHCENKNELKKFIENCNKQKIQIWAIIDKESEKHIGNIKIDPINFKHKIGEYGILIGDSNFWGKGYAFEASKGLIDYYFNNHILRKITLGVISENKAAISLYKKLGFEVEGIYKKHIVYDKIEYDVLRMAIFNNQKWK